MKSNQWLIRSEFICDFPVSFLQWTEMAINKSVFGKNSRVFIIFLHDYEIIQTLVKSILEYASSVWSPSTEFNIDKLEMTQRRVARFVLNDIHQFETYVRTISVCLTSA